MSSDILGYVVGEALPYRFSVVSNKPIRLGDYGVVEYSGVRALCMVERASSGSSTLRNVDRPSSAIRISELAGEVGSSVLDLYYAAVMQVLTDLNSMGDGRPRLPSEPPPPSTPVRRATREELSLVYSPEGRKWVRIGSLLRRPDVEVRIDVNNVVTRHLAVLSMTGYGKSNLVAVLADRVSGLGGTVVIFDVHGEYLGMRASGTTVREVRAAINPLELEEDELIDLLGIPPNARRQRSAVVKAVEKARERFEAGAGLQDFFDLLVEALEEQRRSCGRECSHIDAALDRITLSLNWYRRIFDVNVSSPVDSLAEGTINVVDVSGLTGRRLDAVVSHYLSSIFEERRRAYMGASSRLSMPLIVVLEEAHVLLPPDEQSSAKYWASRIAREGRKFGVGMVIVSQRPRRIDPDILSQMGSMAIMRIIQREDQSSVKSAAEGLSEELAEQLSGLNPGEALLIGAWVRMPAIAKIDVHEGKRAGGDIDAVEEWELRRGPERPADSDLLDLG